MTPQAMAAQTEGMCRSKPTAQLQHGLDEYRMSDVCFGNGDADNVVYGSAKPGKSYYIFGASHVRPKENSQSISNAFVNLYASQIGSIKKHYGLCPCNKCTSQNERSCSGNVNGVTHFRPQTSSFDVLQLQGDQAFFRAK